MIRRNQSWNVRECLCSLVMLWVSLLGQNRRVRLLPHSLTHFWEVKLSAAHLEVNKVDDGTVDPGSVVCHGTGVSRKYNSGTIVTLSKKYLYDWIFTSALLLFTAYRWCSLFSGSLPPSRCVLSSLYKYLFVILECSRVPTSKTFRQLFNALLNVCSYCHFSTLQI